MSEFLNTITNEEVAALPKGVFHGSIEIVDTEAGVNAACDYLLKCPRLGFDTETRPSFKAGVTNKVALLQLSSEERCFLFRLSRMRLDKAILKVLSNPDIIKVGAAVHDDLKGLQSLRRFRPAGFVDLQSIAGQYGIGEKSVRKLAAIVLGYGISKAQRLSNWEAASYTQAQMSYAATDAWVCLEIYNKMTGKE